MIHAATPPAPRKPFRWSLAAAAALSLGLAVAACDEKSDDARTENPPDAGTGQVQTTPPPTTPPAQQPPQRATPEGQPPSTAPGAQPSQARVVGTWMITEASVGGPGTAPRGDKAEATTYRFEEGGKVTVAGSKQCTYSMQENQLKVDCEGTTTEGKIEFRDADQTIVWTVGADETITLKKR